MRLMLMGIIATLMINPPTAVPDPAQDSPLLRAEVFADRSVFMPNNSSYPLVALAGDSKGHIYVLAFDQVVMLGQSGEVIKQLTLKKGQGPGEVQNYPAVMKMGLDDNLYLQDGAKIVIYSADFTFIRNVPVMIIGKEIYIDNEGNIYCRKSDYRAFPPEEFLARFNAQGKLVGEYLRAPDLAMSMAGGMAIRAPHPYLPTNIFGMDARGTVYFMPNTGTQVSYLDTRGTAIPAFKVEAKNIPISKDEKTEIERNYVGRTKSNTPMNVELHYADHRPYYRKILIDEEGRFYLVRTESVLAEGKDATVDIYQDGRHRMELRLGGDPLIVHRGYLYFLVNKDDGIGALTGALMRARVPN